MKKSKIVYAEISMIIVTIIWGFGFPIAQLAIDAGFGTYSILFFRFGTAIVLLPLVFIKRLKILDRKYLIAGIITGSILFVGFFLQTKGLIYTTPSKNAFITQTCVIMTPFVYWLIFKKNVDKYAYIAAFIALMGMGLLTLDSLGFRSLNMGDLMTFGCAISVAFHVVLTSHFIRKYSLDPVMYTFVQMALCAVLSIVFMLSTESWPVLSFASLWPPLFLGIFNTALGFTVQTIAIKYTSPTRTSVIVSMEALFGAIASVMIIGEIISLKMIIGGTLIILALIISETKLSFFKKRI